MTLNRTQEEAFSDVLLEFLVNVRDAEPDGGWVAIRELYDPVMQMANQRSDRAIEMDVKKQSRLRKRLVDEEMIEQSHFKPEGQKYAHFYVRATDETMQQLGSLEEDVDFHIVDRATLAESDLPEPSYRLASGHLMPAKMWKGLVDGVRSGAWDLVVVEHDRRLKVPFWDEVGQ